MTHSLTWSTRRPLSDGYRKSYAETKPEMLARELRGRRPRLSSARDILRARFAGQPDAAWTALLRIGGVLDARSLKRPQAGPLPTAGSCARRRERAGSQGLKVGRNLTLFFFMIF
jgi:hypothetical protein